MTARAVAKSQSRLRASQPEGWDQATLSAFGGTAHLLKVTARLGMAGRTSASSVESRSPPVKHGHPQLVTLYGTRVFPGYEPRSVAETSSGLPSRRMWSLTVSPT